MASEEERRKKEEKERKEKEKKKEEEKASEIKAKDKMINNIAKIIAVINPKYASQKPEHKSKLAKAMKLKNEGKFWSAVDTIEPRDTSDVGDKFELSYNSSSESLEPVYFWLLDFMTGTLGFANIEKIIDNFTSSPGSGHFSELMGKATRMQEEAMKVMQTIGVLVKSLINIVYDLRQFEIRLEDYKAARSENKNRAEAGQIALKQVWMDNVDVKRGNTSIKALAFSQASFATLIDSFMMAKSLDEIKTGLDLNDRVKRILEQRFLEFEKWVELSEKELQKRYNIQKNWLRSQVSSLKLYSRWATPYLRAAEELRMSTNLSGNAALIKTFNTVLMQLTIMAKKKMKVYDSVVTKDLPRGFDKLDESGKIRATYECVFVDFTFRGIPQRVEQHYGFGGKSDVVFRTYGLNEEELDELKKRLEESDMNEALKLVEDITQTSMQEIQKDIDYFLKDEDEREAEDSGEDKKGKTEDVNPFTALVNFGAVKGMFGKASKEEEKRKAGAEIKSDNYAESVVRKLALVKAKKDAFVAYDVYKKAHGMASQPFGDQIWNANTDVDMEFKGVFKKSF